MLNRLVTFFDKNLRREVLAKIDCHCNETKRSSCSITKEESRNRMYYEERSEGENEQNGEKGKYQRRLSTK